MDLIGRVPLPQKRHLRETPLEDSQRIDEEKDWRDAQNMN